MKPTNPPEASSRLRVPRKKLAAVLGLTAVLAAAGLAVGSLADPFLFILYFQLAALGLAIVLLFSVRRDFFLLAVAAVGIVLVALGRDEAAIAAGGLFAVALLGRILIRRRRSRAPFNVAATIAVGLAFLGFLVILRKPAGPAPAAAANGVEAMKSLPYSSFAANENGNRDGVIRNRKDAAAPGLNLYNSYYRPEADLLDMDGKVLHRWASAGGSPQWHYVRLLPNGDLLVCVEDVMLMRLDWRSKVLWQRPMRTHHEIVSAGGGEIITLASEEEIVTFCGLPIPIIDDFIEILDGRDGALKKRISLFQLLRLEIPPGVLGRIYAQILDPRDYLWRVLKQRRRGEPLLRRLTPFDVFHANAVKVLDRRIEGLCEKGDFLLSLRALDMIAIVDAARGILRWSWGPGQMEEQHDPTLLENGHILIFDNGTRRKYSRILEIDPLTKAVVWEYHDLGPTLFFSSWGGSAQRLANGDTLITDSDDGRVFEVTRGGETVWDYLNPDDGENGRRATIYRMTRITDPLVCASLRKLVAPPPRSPGVGAQ